ncbi:MAG: TetR/AcrR family transcriptional regulator [Rhizobiaceae bacterium]|nr:TetR/AcrR family transcriptional regulator [Rhizobiaceae bacterium]
MTERSFANLLGARTPEHLCTRIFERHAANIRVKKPQVAVKNLVGIVAALLKLSNRQGFHATSLRNLADETGLSMGGLYSYFDSKDALLVMILEEVENAVSELFAAVPLEIHDDPAKHLRWVIEGHIRLTEIMQPWFAFAYMEAKSFPKKTRSAAVESELRTESEIAQIIERGAARGVFHVADPGLAAALIKPLLQDWYVKRAKYRKRGTSIDAYVAATTAFVERALMRHGEDAAPPEPAQPAGQEM